MASVTFALTFARVVLWTGVARAQVYGDIDGDGRVDRTYAVGRVSSSGAQWTGARAEIEVRSGSLQGSDAQNGGFVMEALWVGPLASPYWVEVGVTRGWQGQDILTFYWVSRNATPPHYREHKVWNLIAPNYVGKTPEFKITNIDGTQRWRVWIDGLFAKDENNDDSIATVPFSRIDSFDVGLESNCTSGRMGTRSDPVDAKGLKKRVPSGSWSFGPSGGFTRTEYNPLYGVSIPHAYGSWNHPGQNLWNYRNDTAP